MPAPEQRTTGVVGADQGVARLDLRVVIAVGPDVERGAAVLKREILDQIGHTLPDDLHRSRCQRRTVTAVFGVDHIVGLLLIDDVAVGALCGEILAPHNPDEERGRSRSAVASRTAQDQRTAALLIVLERGGGSHRQGSGRGVDRDFVPSGGLGSDAEAIEVRGREVDRHGRRFALREEDGGRVEGERTFHVVIAARDEEGGGQSADPPSESFHRHRVFTEFQIQKPLQRYQKAGQILLSARRFLHRPGSRGAEGRVAVVAESVRAAPSIF